MEILDEKHFELKKMPLKPAWQPSTRKKISDKIGEMIDRLDFLANLLSDDARVKELQNEAYSDSFRTFFVHASKTNSKKSLDKIFITALNKDKAHLTEIREALSNELNFEALDFEPVIEIGKPIKVHVNTNKLAEVERNLKSNVKGHDFRNEAIGSLKRAVARICSRYDRYDMMFGKMYLHAEFSDNVTSRKKAIKLKNGVSKESQERIAVNLQLTVPEKRTKYEDKVFKVVMRIENPASSLYFPAINAIEIVLCYFGNAKKLGERGILEELYASGDSSAFLEVASLLCAYGKLAKYRRWEDLRSIIFESSFNLFENLDSIWHYREIIKTKEKVLKKIIQILLANHEAEDYRLKPDSAYQLIGLFESFSEHLERLTEEEKNKLVQLAARVAAEHCRHGSGWEAFRRLVKLCPKWGISVGFRSAPLLKAVDYVDPIDDFVLKTDCIMVMSEHFELFEVLKNTFEIDLERTGYAAAAKRALPVIATFAEEETKQNFVIFLRTTLQKRLPQLSGENTFFVSSEHEQQHWEALYGFLQFREACKLSADSPLKLEKLKEITDLFLKRVGGDYYPHSLWDRIIEWLNGSESIFKQSNFTEALFEAVFEQYLAAPNKETSSPLKKVLKESSEWGTVFRRRMAEKLIDWGILNQWDTGKWIKAYELWLGQDNTFLKKQFEQVVACSAWKKNQCYWKGWLAEVLISEGDPDQKLEQKLYQFAGQTAVDDITSASDYFNLLPENREQINKETIHYWAKCLLLKLAWTQPDIEGLKTLFGSFVSKCEANKLEDKLDAFQFAQLLLAELVGGKSSVIYKERLEALWPKIPVEALRNTKETLKYLWSLYDFKEESEKTKMRSLLFTAIFNSDLDVKVYADAASQCCFPKDIINLWDKITKFNYDESISKRLAVTLFCNPLPGEAIRQCKELSFLIASQKRNEGQCSIAENLFSLSCG